MNQKQFNELCSEIAAEKMRIKQLQPDGQNEERILGPISNLVRRMENLEPALEDDQLNEVGSRVGTFLDLVAMSFDCSPGIRKSIHAHASHAVGICGKRRFQYQQMRQSG
jgi:hypothetical protein